MVDALKGQVVADYVENVKEDASATPILKDLAQQGHKLIFATTFGYMDQTRRGRQAVPERDVRALHRLQARRQSRHLQFPLPSGPRGRGRDRRNDDEVEHDRLSRLLQGAGSGARRERLHPRRAGGESEGHDQAHHDRTRGSIRPRRRPPSRRWPTSAATSSPSTPTARPAFRSASSARSGVSATPPT